MNLIPGQLLKNKLDSFPLQSRLSQQTIALRKRSTRQPLFKKKKSERDREPLYSRINGRNMNIKMTESQKLLPVL
jgi:hypothetical protein